MVVNKGDYFTKANASGRLIDIIPEEGEYVNKFNNLNKVIKYNIKKGQVISNVIPR